MRAFLLLLTIAVLGGCETASSSPSQPVRDPEKVTTSASVEKKSYGEGVSPELEMVALTDLFKTPEHYADKTIRTEGKVTAVCKAKGCWLEIGDEQKSAHIKLGNHSFFVPRSAAGQHAVVQAKVIVEPGKSHCQMEAEEETGRVASLKLDATGVELSPRP